MQAHKRIGHLNLTYTFAPQEFLRVHKRNAEVWDNDAVLECVENYTEQTKEGGDEEKAEAEDDDADSVEEEENNVDVAKDTTVSDLEYLKSKTVKEKVPVTPPRFVCLPHGNLISGQETQEGAQERDLLHRQAVRASLQGQEEGRQVVLQAAETEVSLNNYFHLKLNE